MELTDRNLQVMTPSHESHLLIDVLKFHGEDSTILLCYDPQSSTLSSLENWSRSFTLYLAVYFSQIQKEEVEPN